MEWLSWGEGGGGRKHDMHVQNCSTGHCQVIQIRHGDYHTGSTLRRAAVNDELKLEEI